MWSWPTLSSGSLHAVPASRNASSSDLLFKLGILGAGHVRRRPRFWSASRLVQVGRNCVIDPAAVIHGPTTIGDNVTDQCRRRDRELHHRQQRQHLSGCPADAQRGWRRRPSCPFGAGLFMTTVMENSMVAQNTCLQLSVIGRNTFVGAGSTFTDYNLIPKPLRARAGDRRPQPLQPPGPGLRRWPQLPPGLWTGGLSVPDDRVGRGDRRSPGRRPGRAL